MDLNIRGEKLIVTKAMKDLALEKLGKLSKYIDNYENLTCYMLFRINGPKQKLEVTIPLKTVKLRIEEEGTDFYSILDTVIDKLERQIIKNKTKLLSKKTRAREEFILDFNYPDIEENKSKIIKRKSMELKPIDEEEAILQLELIGHDFYMFKDKNTNKIKVIYKRNNGGYGLIEEE